MDRDLYLEFAPKFAQDTAKTQVICHSNNRIAETKDRSTQIERERERERTPRSDPGPQEPTVHAFPTSNSPALPLCPESFSTSSTDSRHNGHFGGSLALAKDEVVVTNLLAQP